MSAAHEQIRETGTLHDDCCPCYKKCVVMVLMRWRTPPPWSQHVRPHMRRNWSRTLHTWGSQATVMIYNILRSQKENLRAGVLREASRRRGHLSRTLLVERRGGLLGVCSAGVFTGQVRDRMHTLMMCQGWSAMGQVWGGQELDAGSPGILQISVTG